MSDSIRVTYHDGLWHVGQDSTRYEDGNGYRLKRDAVIAARALARYLGVELVVHNRKRRLFGWRNSYGHDRPDRPG